MRPSRQPGGKRCDVVPINSSPGVSEEDLGGVDDDFSGWFDDWLGGGTWSGGGRQDRPSGNWPNVSLGFPAILELLLSGIGVPTLVQPPTITPTITIPETVDLGTTTPTRGENVSWNDWMASGNSLPADWNNYPMASDHPDFQGVALGDVLTNPSLNPSGENGMDLGASLIDLVGDLAGAYLTRPVVGSGFATTPTLNPAIVPPPGSQVGMTNNPAEGMKGMVYKKVCGEYRWVKQRRRRRRRLATEGDIKDLAALTGTIGKGQTLKEWIATHPS